MDHVYESLASWLDIYRDEFIQDWQANGNYKKYSDSPFYANYAAIVKALNVLAPLAGHERFGVQEDIALYQ